MKIKSPAVRQYIVMMTKKNRSSTKKGNMAPSNKPSASEAEAGSQQPDVPLTTNNAGETGGLAVPPDLPNTTLTTPTTTSYTTTDDKEDDVSKDPQRLWSDVASKPRKKDSDESSEKISLLGIGGTKVPPKTPSHKLKDPPKANLKDDRNYEDEVLIDPVAGSVDRHGDLLDDQVDTNKNTPHANKNICTYQ